MKPISFPVPKSKIKDVCDDLVEELSRLDSERAIVVTMLQQVRKGCSHEGQKTGYNERDGAWATPCVICGGGVR